MRRLALLAAVACAACSRSAGGTAGAQTRVIHSLHDLIALASLAEVEDAGKHLPHPDVSLDWRDHRDGVSLLRCPPGQSITFPPLTVNGVSQLRVGCGSSAPPGLVSDGRQVRYLVEAARVTPAGDAPGGGAPAFVPIAELVITLPTIETMGPGPIEVDLPFAPPDPAAAGSDTGSPAAGDMNWMLRFSTMRWITDDGPPRAGRPEEMTDLDWPAWISPTLTSPGRRVPLEADPVLVPDSALNFVTALPRAAVMVQDAAHPVALGSIDPTLDSSAVGGRRAAIETAGTTRVRFLLSPEPGDELQWSIGVDGARGWSTGGDGMSFALEIDGERLWEQAIAPATVRSDRRWQAGSLDLARYAGREVSVDLLTDAGPAGDVQGDVGGWASMRIVRNRRVPRLAAGAAPTIVLIVVDTLRVDRLGSAGHPSGLTPRLDTLAARGTVFRAARSPASWTWPATASILTGLSPAEHDVHDSRRCLLLDEIDTLAELCQRKGYSTAAFTSNLLISRSNQFDQGFETFALMPGVTARALNEHAGRWLEQTKGLARMLYVHYLDPHAPYAPPPAYLTAPGVPKEALGEDAAALQAELAQVTLPDGTAPPEVVERFIRAAKARYDAEVAYVDTAIGELLDTLGACGALDDAIVVVTSDHGEEFLEHGGIGHGASLYEETLRVPLIIATFGPRFGAGPGVQAPGVVTAPVTTRDIVPTLIALAGLPEPSHPLSGATLMPADGAAPAAGPFFSETLLGREPPRVTTLEKLAIFDGRWKLVSTPAIGRVELYDLQQDALEREDRALQESSRRDGLIELLRSGYPGLGADAAAGHGEAASEDAIERLAALGYLGK